MRYQPISNAIIVNSTFKLKIFYRKSEMNAPCIQCVRVCVWVSFELRMAVENINENKSEMKKKNAHLLIFN